MWRPKLIVRFGKSGAVSSPTSTGGHAGMTLFVCAFGVVFARGWRGASLGEGVLAMGILAFLVGTALRDTWAWLVASPEEREAFRREVGMARFDRARRRVESVRTRADWSIGVVLALTAATIGCFALVRYRHELVLAGMFSAAFLVVVLLDRAREAQRRRGGHDRGASSRQDR